VLDVVVSARERNEHPADDGEEREPDERRPRGGIGSWHSFSSCCSGAEAATSARFAISIRVPPTDEVGIERVRARVIPRSG
jgi:hypothetical protein